MKDLSDVRVHTQREIEHFFGIYKELEGRRMRMRGWGHIEQAHEVIQQSRSRFLAAEQAGTRSTVAGTA